MKCRLISLDYDMPLCDASIGAESAVIGHAADADIRLDATSIAEHHCRIVSEGDHWIVSDLGTVHGTFVNGAKIEESILRPGDELAIGLLTFLVQPVEKTAADMGTAAEAEAEVHAAVASHASR